MKLPIFIEYLKSKYCLAIFLFTLLIGIYITPKEVFYGEFAFLASIFLLTTAVSLTCIVRHIKETIQQSIKLKSSIISTIAAIFGLITLQACGLSAPVCGATAGTAIVATFFPGIVLKVYQGWGNLFLLSAISFQILGLYFMKCFNFKIVKK